MKKLLVLALALPLFAEVFNPPTINIKAAIKQEAFRLGYYYPNLRKQSSDIMNACHNKDFIACNNLGFLYANNIGFPKNDKRAWQIFSKQCDDNELAIACYNLAKLTNDAYYLKKACDLGDEYSCFMLNKDELKSLLK